jgi:hypothetical protein
VTKQCLETSGQLVVQVDGLAVIEVSRPQPVAAMTVPSNRTASGFAVRQEETWVDFVQ